MADWAVGYVSVHTVDGGPGLDAQHYEIADWCKSHGYKLVTTEGEVIRAGKPVERRAGLIRALMALKDKEASVLVAHHPKRLGETPLEVATVVHLANTMAGAVMFTEPAKPLIQPAPATLAEFVAMLAEFEEVAMAIRNRILVAIKRANGMRTGNAPRGFRAAAGGLVRDAAEAAVVELAEELRAEGMSIRQIAEELERRGVVTRAGRPMHYTSVHKILKGAGK